LSGVVAGVMVLLFVLFLSPLIERIPLAALVGVMFVVSQQTFAWASLRVVNKVPANDVLVIIAVTVITVFTDLAVAVLCGIIIAALDFAWQQARELYADAHMEADGSKLYHLHGTLFFASTTQFLNQFDPANDPALVTVDCRHLSFVDYSAIAALMTLRDRYSKAGKHLRVFHLSERCKRMLKRAGVHHD
ncbi:SulP family inorganic anion transporter, partial [Pseudomonas corrugata]|uniref:STAS domain-containing protein n=1 Tax=Pseudomonas corrugata TaxID=47879 RepID=UPI0018E5D635